MQVESVRELPLCDCTAYRSSRDEREPYFTDLQKASRPEDKRLHTQPYPSLSFMYPAAGNQTNCVTLL